MNSDKGTDKHVIFKREARNYDFYVSSVQRLDDNLTVLVSRLENVHSIPTDQERVTSSRLERPIIKMLEKKGEIEKQREYYIARLEWIHKVIENIPSPAYRAVAWRTFIQRKSLHEISEKYEISQDHLYRLRKHFIEIALTDELMDEYYAIVNPLGTLSDEDEPAQETAQDEAGEKEGNASSSA